MKCPNCNVNLVMSERSGIEIDYCPDCRGVWLDRGELDKIIERSNGATSNQPTYQQHDKKQYSKESDYHYKKKKSIFSELFDF